MGIQKDAKAVNTSEQDLMPNDLTAKLADPGLRRQSNKMLEDEPPKQEPITGSSSGRRWRKREKKK